MVAMAMNGGGAGEPAWWLNLQANPPARVQLADGMRRVVSHAATVTERTRLWERWSCLSDAGQERAAEAVRARFRLAGCHFCCGSHQVGALTWGEPRTIRIFQPEVSM